MLKIGNYPLYFLYFIYLYALFAFERIKKTLSFNIEGFTVTNEIWLVPLGLFIISLIYAHKVIQRTKIGFWIIFYMYIGIILIGALNSESLSQLFYGAALFLLPILLFIPASQLNRQNIIFFLKSIIIICLVYSFAAIILATNFAYFMNLVGNSIDNYRYYDQYRASMMIGSSITVSYFLNITLPLCFYFFFEIDKGKWKIISSIAILLNIIATILLLSRAASFIALLIICFYIFMVQKKKTGMLKKIILLIGLSAGFYYSIINFNVSRIFMGFGTESTNGRLMSADLGLNIFMDNPILGSGISRYFERLYENKFIEVNGMFGLIDPHNLYILILSEMGIIGLLITICLFVYLFKRFKHIKSKTLRQTAFMTLTAFLIGALGGSQLMNEISFSIVFWIHMGIFNAIAFQDEVTIKSGD